METKEYKILLVDDEADIRIFLGYNIKKNGYHFLSCSNGYDAIEIARKEMPHMIILDVMMPEMDGFQTCHELRKIPELYSTIIVFLTARDEDYSINTGYHVGADDYIAKPISPRVLINRIEKLFKKHELLENGLNLFSQENPENIIIDKEKGIVIKNNIKYLLPDKEIDLLSLLISNPNKIIRKEEIYLKIWTHDEIKNIRQQSIDRLIQNLRKKLGQKNIQIIKDGSYIYQTDNTESHMLNYIYA